MNNESSSDPHLEPLNIGNRLAHGLREPPKGCQPDPRDNPHPPEDPDFHYGTKKKELDHIICLRDNVAKQTYLIGWFGTGSVVIHACSSHHYKALWS